MNPQSMSPVSSRRIGRSILALLAGIIVGIILSTGTDSALHAIWNCSFSQRALAQSPLGPGHGLSVDLRNLRRLLHRSPGSHSPDGALACRRSTWVDDEFSWSGRCLEHNRGTALVSGGACSNSTADGLDRRKAVVDANAVTDGGRLGGRDHESEKRCINQAV